MRASTDGWQRWSFRSPNGLRSDTDGAEHALEAFVIPDDLERTGIEIPFDYRDDLEVEWTGGPDWFFRISKFSIPFLRHPWVPRTFFLHEIERLPDLARARMEILGIAIALVLIDPEKASAPARIRAALDHFSGG